jgi:transcriptional regulator with XRE-family HTH domain
MRQRRSGSNWGKRCATAARISASPQAELAERARLQQPAVARFESGGTMPTIPMLERLAGALRLRLNVEFLPLRETS